MIPLGLKNKVALITGAAHGQGRVSARRLAQEGVHIVALDVAKSLDYPSYTMGSNEELNELKRECESLGVGCYPLVCDVRQVSRVADLVQQAESALGPIDILFNNAGICAYGLSEELSEEAFDAMIGVNLKGAWSAGKAVIPGMKHRQSGVIINNVSIASHRGMARLSHYAASKWGLLGLTKSWAIELAPFGIRVLSIHPTGVNTPMNDGLAAMENLSPLEVAERAAGNLLPMPWIEPDDVAEAVVYLASDRARAMTGSEWILDAGLLTR